MESSLLVLQELVMTDPRFFRKYLDIVNEAPATKKAAPAAQPAVKAPTPTTTSAAPAAPQGSMSNMPGAKAYSDAADPMAATNAQYQQTMQNIQGEKGQRLQAHMAARDQAIQKYGGVSKAISSGEVDALGPSGDPLQRSSVSTTDLKQKERAAGEEYTATRREKTGGGHWQYDKKTVDSAVGPISQTNATYIATPTKGEVIRQGLAGGGSLYNRRSTLHDPNALKPPPGATVLNPTGQTQAQAPAIQSATTTPAAPQAAPAATPAPTAPQPPVQEDGDDELQKLKEFLNKKY
jgi:hypothetical protein